MSDIIKQSIGIDIAKDKFDVCFSVINLQQKVTIKSTRKFSNKPAGFKEFDNWLEKHIDPACSLVFVLEATGVYYEQLAWHLYQKDYHISVVLPNKAKKYHESLGLKSKNDKIDAKGLARMGAEQALDKWQPLSIDFYHLRSLTRETEDLNNIKTTLNNQLHAMENTRIQSESSITRIKQHIALIDKQITAIKNEIFNIVNANADLKERMDKILEIKGLGLESLVTVIAECNGFALIRNQKQLVSYAGYDVVENQSGNRKGKTRISKKGNRHIRRILHMPAFNVVKYEPKFKCLYERLIKNCKTKMQAYVAVQKKLLVLIYALWKKNESYCTNHNQSYSGNDETKLLSPHGFEKAEKNSPENQSGAIQDELPSKESTEVLSPQMQI
jgi:transposase